MKAQISPQQIQDQWQTGVERAAQDQARVQDLGDMLTESSGLHIKSGVQAGNLWGTSYTCASGCNDPATQHIC